MQVIDGGIVGTAEESQAVSCRAVDTEAPDGMASTVEGTVEGFFKCAYRCPVTAVVMSMSAVSVTDLLVLPL